MYLDFILMLLVAWAALGALLGVIDEALVLRWYSDGVSCDFGWSSVVLGALLGPLALISVVATIRKWRWG
jgi:hypothetical protein